MRGTLVICADSESLGREAARRIVAAAASAEKSPSQPFRLALAGGSTPRRLYELLASSEFQSCVPWKQVHFFWGDERLVPLDHPDSNYRMAYDTLLRHLPVPRENVHPVPVQSSAAGAAQAYEQELRAHFQKRRGVPVFDLVLLGMGADGHTASLFPGAPILGEKKQLVVAHIPGGAQARVTMTLPVFNHARRVFFLVAGKDKAVALHAALEGRGQLPAQLVAPKKGELLWLVDTMAASRLESVRVEPPVASLSPPQPGNETAS